MLVEYSLSKRDKLILIKCPTVYARPNNQKKISIPIPYFAYGLQHLNLRSFLSGSILMFVASMVQAIVYFLIIWHNILSTKFS